MRCPLRKALEAVHDALVRARTIICRPVHLRSALHLPSVRSRPPPRAHLTGCMQPRTRTAATAVHAALGVGQAWALGSSQGAPCRNSLTRSGAEGDQARGPRGGGLHAPPRRRWWWGSLQSRSMSTTPPSLHAQRPLQHVDLVHARYAAPDACRELVFFWYFVVYYFMCRGGIGLAK